MNHFSFPVSGKDLIQRVIDFRKQMRAWWSDRRPDVVHVRSIYEGYPLARDKVNSCGQLVFEVNGLPSIELKYHYPDVADDRELMQKLRHQEDVCLNAADLVLTVSDTNARHLLKRGVSPRQLRVIPNGVDTELFSFRKPKRELGPSLQLIYAGTLSSWQGVRLAIEALALFQRDNPAQLMIVGEGRKRQRRELLREIEHKQLGDSVRLLEPVSQADLVRLYHQADIILAPLLANDRNVVQGCCPLKVLEAMSCGTPLISSNLAVVRELARSGQDALLVRAGSAKAIKDGMLRLMEERGLGLSLAAAARRRVKQGFTWNHATDKLVDAYREVLAITPLNSSSSVAASCEG